MRRRDRKRLQNWLLFCLLAAAAVVCIFGRVRQMAQRRQEQEQQLENGQAILTDAADAALVEERSLENWLPDVLVSEISPAFGSEVWKAQSVLARTWLLNTAVEAGRAATVTDVQKDMRLSLKELRGAGWSGDGQEWAEADTGVRRLCKSSISATGGGILVQESAEVGRMFPPLFHLCSAGRTRDGGTRYPGLCSVKSTTDLLVTEAVQVQFFTTEQFRTRITEVLGETIAAEEAQADRLSYEKEETGQNKTSTLQYFKSSLHCPPPGLRLQMWTDRSA